MKAIFAAAGLATVFVMAFTVVDVEASSIWKRQIGQQKRIHHGVRGGELTLKEAWHLQRQQAYIQHLKRRALSDGCLSRAERYHIRSSQDRADRHIYRYKRNIRHR